MPPPPTEPELAWRALRDEVRAQARLLGGFVGLLWVIHIVNVVLFGGRLVALGIQPRSLTGLLGIFFAPFLHGGFAHLAANTLPLVALGALVMTRRKRDLLIVSALSCLVGGLGTWLIAPAASVHVGASILIFGYLGFLLLRGIFERKVWSILGSVLVFLVYGGALWGVLPGQIGISWQGHLFGLLGGVLAARLLHSHHDTPALASSKAPALGKARIAAPRARLDEAPPAEEDETIEDEIERLRGKR